jgi:hypothetical protein
MIAFRFWFEAFDRALLNRGRASLTFLATLLGEFLV